MNIKSIISPRLLILLFVASNFFSVARVHADDIIRMAMEPYLKGCEIGAELLAPTAVHYTNQVIKILKANPNTSIEKLNKSLKEKFELKGDELYEFRKDVKKSWQEALDKENATASRRRDVWVDFEAHTISLNLCLEITLLQVTRAVNESENFSESRFQRNIENECKKRIYASASKSK